ncbi:hypothetical protein CYY_002767 [Polysphondylium violaceum]|uniref:Mediator of RNA polymerase II transcription subunit 21 n=1 Tax=Polysphondylium violaceum TaxID=133409 RepID=A0A8J4PZL2_9MYCE|nr:hypothetical protein CYY_002767 [Polysphondylium violaceum]
MDRITQLQDKLDDMFYIFGTCIGVLQRDAPPVSFKEQNELSFSQEWGHQIGDMATQVIDTSKLIESYIDSLPGLKKTETEQYENLKSLNSESNDTLKELKLTKSEAIEMLKLVKESIRYISEESKLIEDQS